MKFKYFKKISILLISILSLSIIGCNETFNKQEKTSNVADANLNTLLEYKDTYVGDNSAIGNIISNLPAHIYNTGFQLKTTLEPYEITLNYDKFKDVSIIFDDNSSIISPFKDVIKNNAMIIISLVENVDIVNFNIDDSITITYERNTLIDSYKDDYGNNLEEISKNSFALEEFIKTNKD